MSSPQLISILMPAYNTGRYISEAIRSVQAQTHTNWELIIVDDGSNDDTFSVAENFSSHDKRIRLYRNNSNRGLGFTTNFALQQARSEIVAKLDSDDIVEPCWLEKRLRHLANNPSLVAVSGSRIVINPAGRKTKTLTESYSPIVVKWKLVFGNPVVHPGIVFRYSNGVEYQPLHYFEDWDLWSRVIEKGGIEVVNDHQVHYRVHASSATQKKKIDEAAKGVIHNIMARQCLRYFNEAPDPETGWYLYRDRKSFRGEKKKISKAVETLNRYFRMFISQHSAEKNEMRALKLAYWDQFLHLARTGRISRSQILYAEQHYGLGPRDLFMDKTGRRIGLRKACLAVTNFFR